MALTLRSNGNNPINIVGAQWFNDFYDALTGVMTDQPYTLNYRPASSTSTPTLGLETNGNAPLFIGYNSAGTNVFEVDQNGMITFGGPTSGSYPKFTWDGTNHIVVAWTPQAGGTALGYVVVTWNGSAQVNALAVGGNFVGAKAFFDNSGNLTLTGAVLTGNGASITVGNGTNDIVLSPGSGHWTYLNNNNTNAYVDQSGNIHGVALYDNGSRAAVQGAHSAGQTVVSYGSGVPGTLNVNEVYFQVS